ncbi:MAG: hypothetical protein KAV87_64405, partial [Desulfobacteraceae bacterium]|nr:hypothetical protein [Desulfobacteraceae bacterium]
MGKRLLFGMTCTIFIMSLVIGAGEKIEAKELVSNPTFKAAETEKLPAGWSVWKPVWDKAACRLRSIGEGLLVEA